MPCDAPRVVTSPRAHPREADDRSDRTRAATPRRRSLHSPSHGLPWPVCCYLTTHEPRAWRPTPARRPRCFDPLPSLRRAPGRPARRTHPRGRCPHPAAPRRLDSPKEEVDSTSPASTGAARDACACMPLACVHHARAAYCPSCSGASLIMSSMRRTVMAASVANWIILTLDMPGSRMPA